ncbi:MAG: putative methyltransferase [Verrucomicrobiales bacterium]|jgi:predicted methyltransferase
MSNNRTHRPSALPRATELAHSWVAAHLPAGGIAIDATAGNGHDTLFLAHTCGASGKVFAFDIQQEAIDATRARLSDADVHHVELHQLCHSQITSTIPQALAGQVDAIMFNLGYLPGGDKECLTQTATTLRAIEHSLPLLTPGGIMTIAIYPGHPGGDKETAAVQEYAANLSAPDWHAAHFRPLNQPKRPPELIGIVRRNH